MPAHEEGGAAIVTSMAKGLAGAVRGAAALGANVARHAGWYLLYRVDGNSRAQRERDRRRRR